MSNVIILFTFVTDQRFKISSGVFAPDIIFQDSKIFVRSGPNAIKLFTEFTNFCNKLVFVAGNIFQPSLMLVDEARSTS